MVASALMFYRKISDVLILVLFLEIYYLKFLKYHIEININVRYIDKSGNITTKKTNGYYVTMK